uniref:Cadherin domain-containing protein n=1 Tax=Scophthalmus maximus TaxID=52904 RepID=A0A8D3CBP7_SCOMX
HECVCVIPKLLLPAWEKMNRHQPSVHPRKVPGREGQERLHNTIGLDGNILRINDRLRSNSVKTYKLSQNDHFSLDVQSGGEHGVSAELVLQKSLDREKQSVIKLILTAVDGGKPPRSGTLQLTVNVIDVNDNIPTFSKSLYKVRVKENAAPGELVIKLNATDLDEGMNSKILYSFLKRGNIDPSNIFDLNSESGEITVKGTLNYEETSAYEVRVQAVDQGPVPRSAHAKLLIEIIDVNDNAPEISVTSLMTPRLEIFQSAGPFNFRGVKNVSVQSSGHRLWCSSAQQQRDCERVHPG